MQQSSFGNERKEVRTHHTLKRCAKSKLYVCDVSVTPFRFIFEID